MSAPDSPPSGDTRHRLRITATVAMIISCAVTTAASVTTMMTRPPAQLSIFLSLLVAVGLGLYIISS